MSAAQLDELPPENNGNEAKQAGSLVPALVAIILAPVITVGAMYFLIKLNKPDVSGADSITQGGVHSIWNPQVRRNSTNLVL